MAEIIHKIIGKGPGITQQISAPDNLKLELSAQQFDAILAAISQLNPPTVQVSPENIIKIPSNSPKIDVHVPEQRTPVVHVAPSNPVIQINPEAKVTVEVANKRLLVWLVLGVYGLLLTQGIEAVKALIAAYF